MHRHMCAIQVCKYSYRHTYKHFEISTSKVTSHEKLNYSGRKCCKIKGAEVKGAEKG